jgi:hypothetical protein
MDRSHPHAALRRVAVAVVVSTGLVLGRAGPAVAGDPPSASDLVGKLIEEDVCEERARPVTVGRHEVTCRTDLHGGTLIRVQAYSAARRLRRSVLRAVAASCGEPPPDGVAPARSVVLVVGPTWYAKAAPSHNKAIARWLDGDVRSYACS